MRKLIFILLLLPLFVNAQVLRYGNKAIVFGNKAATYKQTTTHEFSPLDIDSCVLWLKADAGVTFNGSTVSAWADQSGNGNDLIQVFATQQPTYTPNALNGKPGLYFDGGDWLTSTNNYITNPLINPQPITTFIVFTFTSGAVIIGSTNVSQRNQFGYGGGTLYTYAGSVGSYSHSIPFTGYFTILWNGGNSKLWEGGVEKISADFGTQYLSDLQLGTLQNSGANTMTGYMYEVIYYHKELTLPERIKVEQYLATKYGL